MTFDPYPLVLLGIGIFTIVFLIVYLRINAFLALIGAALVIGFLSDKVVGAGAAWEFVHVPEIIASAFGRLMGGIGIPIALATIVGLALMESGAADRIVRAFTGLFGERFAPFALLVSGFVLSIPVFFDTVFLLLVPLAKAMRLRTGKNYLFYVVAIGAGGAVTHSLVPPTPGPIAMAETLKVDLGMTILVGIVVGAPVALVGFAYAGLANKLWPTPLRQVGSVPMEELEKIAHRPAEELPNLFVSFMPIALPVVLIASLTIYDRLVPQAQITDATNTAPIVITSNKAHGLETGALVSIDKVAGNTAANGSFTITRIDGDKFSLNGSKGNGEYKKSAGKWMSDKPLFVVNKTSVTPRSLLALVGNKNIALLIGTVIAMLLVVRQKLMSRQQLATFTATALDQAGMILLITCAGGAFGAMLTAVGVGASLGNLAEQWGLSLLILAWATAALMKIAQGSGTVAMITTSGIVMGIIASQLGMSEDAITLEAMANLLGYHPVYLVMAIGLGSKIASWMNDSGFWVVCKMGGLTEEETLRSWTICLVVMGLAGLPLVYLLTRILPLV